MPRFDKRRILRKELYIFRQTGQLMVFYVRKSRADTIQSLVPDDIISSSMEPTESSDEFQVFNVFGKFEEIVGEKLGTIGRQSQVSGVVTIPYLYKGILAATDYIDPYPATPGSRFIKVGTMSEESRLFITQKITGVTLAQQGEAL